MSNKKKYTFITVEQLIEHLKNFSRSIPVGSVGHFGEFIPIRKEDFRIRKANLVPDHRSWRDRDPDEVEVLHIDGMDVGPDPD